LEVARDLDRRLATEGFKIWFDKPRLRPGDNWYDEIKGAADNARIILPILTPRWKQSNWTKFETYAAETVIPLIFEGAWPEISTPPLQRFHNLTVDLSKSDASCWQQLIDAVRKQLARPIPEKLQRLSHVPYQHNRCFVGREKEMLVIHETLHQNPTAALTQGSVHAIAAMGGVGKTTLAREYVETFWRCYPQIFWIDCRLGISAGLANVFEILSPDRGHLLKEPEKADCALRELNSDKLRLLVLDNAEDEESIHKWIPGAGACRTIITSRYSNWSPGIVKLEMYVLDPEPARELLMKRVDRLVEGDEMSACDALAKDLGYLPLALEQAAAYMAKNRHYTFHKYLEYYRRVRTELLEKKVLGSTQYPDAVATTWNVTIEKLSAPARSVLRLASFLADTPIPLGLFRTDIQKVKKLAQQFPRSPPGSTSIDAELFINDLFGELHDYSMARLNSDSVQFHNLVQAVEAAQHSTEHRERAVDLVWGLFQKFAPSPSFEFVNWHTWKVLLPHAKRLVSQSGTSSAIRAWVLNEMACYVQLARAAYSEAEAMLRQVLDMDRKALPAQHPDIAISLSNLVAALTAQGKFAEAQPLADEAMEIRLKTLSPSHPKVAKSLTDLAFRLHNKGNLPEAFHECQRALDILRATLDPDHPEIARCLHEMANILKDDGSWPKAEPLFREALEIRRKALPARHPDIATSLNDLASLLVEQGKLSEGEPLLREAFDIRREVLPASHPDIANSTNNLAVLLKLQWKCCEAEPLFREALEMYRNAYPGGHPIIATCSIGLAALLRDQRKFAEAEPLYVEALEMRRKFYPAGHSKIVESLNGMADLLRDQENPLESEQLYREALRILRETVPAIHPEIATTLDGLAMALHDQEKFFEAEPLYREALEIRRQVLPAWHRATACSLNNLAYLLRDQGNVVEAEPLFREAVEAFRRCLPKGHPQIATSLHNLASLLAAQGIWVEAESLIHEALAIRRQALPAGHPETAKTISVLANLMDKTGRKDEARELLS
jgi:tetratricopeptide (TPR) repeat protein